MHQLLIIDDQTILADDLAEMLPWHSVGIGAVHKAYSAREALDVMNEYPIDVIVTDIRMPGMSGLELIAEIRKKWKRTKCILLSGFSDFAYAKEAMLLRSSDYLLKPVADQDLLNAVAKAVRELEDEWREISSIQRTMYALKEQLPKLREYLLLDLLTGKLPPDSPVLAARLASYESPMRAGDAFHLLLVRLDDAEGRYGDDGEPLIEYAVANIAEEIFSDRMRLWHCHDGHGYTVFLLSERPDAAAGFRGEELGGWIERRTFQLQQAARTYLKIGLSVLTSKQGAFPADAASYYQASLSNFRRYIGQQRELYVSLAKAVPSAEPQPLSELYRLPSLAQLLEVGQWDAVQSKTDAIFRELEVGWNGSQELVLEAYFMIAAAVSSFVHRNKKWLADTIGDDFHAIAGGKAMDSLAELRDWTARVLEACRRSASNEEKDSRSNVIRQVQDYIAAHLGEASLQSISAHVFLNPSYLSKIYKLETGEGISEYLLRVRMEKAAELLAQPGGKVYEISETLGYQKPSYFISLFKKHIGLTPQEYRNKLGV